VKSLYLLLVCVTAFFLFGNGMNVAVAGGALNAAQMAKVERLAAASGVSPQTIINMRLGITIVPPGPGNPPPPPGGLPEPPPPPETELTEGLGWGEIARLLGVDPSVLGNGNASSGQQP